MCWPAGLRTLAGFLQRGGMDRRLQLAQRLADLYDQYQVYRSDWLAAWAAGRTCCPPWPRRPPGAAKLPTDQRWQALLWRELLAPLSPRSSAASHRPACTSASLAALQAPAVPGVAPLPRRVVLFGMTHVPQPTLQAAGRAVAPQPGAAGHAQPLPLPLGRHHRRPRTAAPCSAAATRCATGRTWPRAAGGHARPRPPAAGRLGPPGRDFVRQLDAFDDAQQASAALCRCRAWTCLTKAPDAPLLQQVQQRIRDLVPLAEHPQAARWTPTAPSSFTSPTARSARSRCCTTSCWPAGRTRPLPGRPLLQPRDIVVMVPDIDDRAGHPRGVWPVRAQRPAPHPLRHCRPERAASSPLVVALEWLLRLPQQRCR
jgi:exodeoxyribonuclease V gamma subunit